MAIIVRITPLLLPFGTGAFFKIDSFNVRPLDGKLLVVGVSELEPFDMTPPYELRVCREALCAEKVHGDVFARFVV